MHVPRIDGTHVTGVLIEMEMPPTPKLLVAGGLLVPPPPATVTGTGDAAVTDEGCTLHAGLETLVPACAMLAACGIDSSCGAVGDACGCKSAGA
jgi:hypothetical protein